MKKIGRIKYITKGEYDPTVTYNEMEVVLYNGSLWEPKKETTGNAPPETQQNEDGTPASNEWWQLFLPGALGDDYVKKTDIAKAPTDTTAGNAGIVYPDGKTITADENGMLTGAPSGKTMTKEEMDAQLAIGELQDGDVVYVEGEASGEDGIIITVDQTVKPDSKNAVSGKAVYNELQKHATTEQYGTSKICPIDVTDTTEADGGVCGAWEKNPTKEGSLAYNIKNNSLDINGLKPKLITLTPNLQTTYKPKLNSINLVSTCQFGAGTAFTSLYLLTFSSNNSTCKLIPIHELKIDGFVLSVNKNEGLVINNGSGTLFYLYIFPISL